MASNDSWSNVSSPSRVLSIQSNDQYNQQIATAEAILLESIRKLKADAKFMLKNDDDHHNSSQGQSHPLYRTINIWRDANHDPTKLRDLLLGLKQSAPYDDDSSKRLSYKLIEQVISPSDPNAPHFDLSQYHTYWNELGDFLKITTDVKSSSAKAVRKFYRENKVSADFQMNLQVVPRGPARGNGRNDTVEAWVDYSAPQGATMETEPSEEATMDPALEAMPLGQSRFGCTEGIPFFLYDISPLPEKGSNRYADQSANIRAPEI